MNTDHRKAMNITYNHLNLPEQFNIGGDIINITYDHRLSRDAVRAGVKLKKESIGIDGSTTIRHYVGGIEYTGYTNLQVEAIYHTEGRAVPTDDPTHKYRYEYTLTDHLGNGRVYFTDSDYDGTVDAATEILQQAHYYPFGMNMKGLPDNTQAGQVNPYQYNGLFKDGVGALSLNLNEDFGLNLSDYGARWYDAAVGRFWTIDRFAEKYLQSTGYGYVQNNPINSVDINGDSIRIRIDDNNIATCINGNLYNSDGSEYRGKGVKVKKDGTVKLRGFLKRVVRSLQRLENRTEEGNKIISDLSNSEHDFFIQNTEGGNMFVPDDDGAYGTNVFTNNSNALHVLEQGELVAGHLPFSQIGDGGTIFWNGSTIQLGHELAHAHDSNYGLLDSRPTKINGEFVTIREARAVYRENLMRRQLGMRLRTRYGDGQPARLLDANNNPINYTNPAQMRLVNSVRPRLF